MLSDALLKYFCELESPYDMIAKVTADRVEVIGLKMRI
jgi:hypothetical protein